MDTTTTTADVLADTLRSAAAWLREAAVQLEAGDLDRAHHLARLIREAKENLGLFSAIRRNSCLCSFESATSWS